NRERIAPWMLETVGCVEAGSRIVSVIPGGDVFGAEGYEGEDFSVAGDEPVVLVVDVIRKLDRAWGEDREVAGSLPHVELAAGGAPSIAIPSSEPSGELELGVL